MLKALLISTTLAAAGLGVPALAQQVPPTSPQEQVALQGLPIYSSDGTQVGQVTQVRVADGQVQSLRAELSAGMGLGAKSVEIPAGKFRQRSDRVELSMTADETGKLPALKQ